MKRLHLIVLFVAAIFHVTAQDSSIPNRLIGLNSEWNSQGIASSQQIPIVANLNEVELIQFHLSFVEEELRGRSVRHLSALQRKNRKATLDILNDYWNAGVFPQNIYHSEKTPYFIDHLRTHCAVGHLMMKTGLVDVAQKIHKENNYAYIAELIETYPSIAQWANEYGFLPEELAWIQPAYTPLCDPCNFEIIVFVNDGTGAPINSYSYEWSSSELDQNILEGVCPGSTYSVEVYDSLGVMVDHENLYFRGGIVSGNTITAWNYNYTTFELDYNYGANCLSSVEIIPFVNLGTNLTYMSNSSYINQTEDGLTVDSLCDGWNYFSAATSFWECHYQDSVFISPDNGYDFLNFTGDTLCFEQCFNITPPESNMNVVMLLSDQYGEFGSEDEDATLVNTGDFRGCLPQGLNYGAGYKLKLISEDADYNNILIPLSIGVETYYTIAPDQGFCDGSFLVETSGEFVIDSYQVAYSTYSNPMRHQLWAGEQILRLNFGNGCTMLDTIAIPLEIELVNSINLEGDTLCLGECFSSQEIDNVINTHPRDIFVFISDNYGNFGELFENGSLIGYNGRDYPEFQGYIPEGIEPGSDYKIAFTYRPHQSSEQSLAIVDVVIQGIEANLTSTPDINGMCNGTAEIFYEADSLLTGTEWIYGGSDLVLDSLCSGWQTVNTYFGNGCVATDSIFVTSELNPEITLVAVSTNTICEDDCFEVNYETIGFTEETEFICELSNELGSFETPVELSGSQLGNSGVISVCYLNNATDGVGYRIRVKSAEGSLVSAANNDDLTINHIEFELNSALGELSIDSEEPNATFQWFDCENLEELEGETDMAFLNGLNGEEYFAIITSNGCSKRSDCTEFEQLIDNILELNNRAFTIFPNPASTIIHIKGEASVLKVTIVDPLGKKVLVVMNPNNSAELSLTLPEKINDGIYYLTIETELEILISKMLIKKS